MASDTLGHRSAFWFVLAAVLLAAGVPFSGNTAAVIAIAALAGLPTSLAVTRQVGQQLVRGALHREATTRRRQQWLTWMLSDGLMILLGLSAGALWGLLLTP